MIATVRNSAYEIIHCLVAILQINTPANYMVCLAVLLLFYLGPSVTEGNSAVEDKRILR